MMLKSGYDLGATMAQTATKIAGRAPANGASATHHAPGAHVFNLATAKPLPLLPAPAEQDGVLARQDLIGLFQAIEAALPGQDCRIVQFAGPGRGEGVTTISAGMATLTAGLLAQRTLFIDLNAEPSIDIPRRKPLASLIDVLSSRALVNNAIIPATNAMPFDYAHLSADNVAGDIVAHHDKIRQLLVTLRSHYRFIIMHASNVLANPTGVSLSQLVDGVVLVVEAEYTRAPAARQALALMSEKGSRILGLAFNKRRYYIPDWLYRRL